MRRAVFLVLALMVACSLVVAPRERSGLSFPPRLPGNQERVTDRSAAMLRPPPGLQQLAVAKEPPSVDLVYYPGQDYEGDPWSAWGDGLALRGHYYSSIGDHRAPEGNAGLYDYDGKRLRKVVDVRSLLKRPAGHYTPGKIHSRIDAGSDGWLYFSTHRGGTKVTKRAESHFEGDWILRYHPQTGKAEIVAEAPAPKRNLPASVVDPKRLLFYAGASDGLNESEPGLLVYDLARRRRVLLDPKGPYRCLMLSRRSGRVYFHTAKEGPAELYRYDPGSPGRVTRLPVRMGARAATEESSAGTIYAADEGQLWAFDTAAETARALDSLLVGEQKYVASLDLDPAERFLYYIPGAHGGSYKDGAPIVQYDLRKRSRKVLAFLHPYYQEKYSIVFTGTYSSALSPEGDKLYVTWNVARVPKGQSASKKTQADSCALTVIHIPASERQ
ncbi:MAG: hypothetical protein HY319_19460 [Armatimonadetes bacterium]|nr:hypothetical protein [Armatimonadota bacterium]